MTRMSAPVPAEPKAILVVDDSAVVRQALRSILERDGRYTVLQAGDPYEAVAVLSRQVPAAIVLDVDMPRMDGLTFLKKLMRQHPLPVVLCTDHPDRGLAGLELGARSIIAKPDWRDANTLPAWGEKLLGAIREAIAPGLDPPSSTLEPRQTADVILARRPYVAAGAPSDRIVAIGASTGGVQAIARLLTGFPRESPGIVIVQHMREDFTNAFAKRLNTDTKIPLEIVEATSNQAVLPGRVLIVPGHTHGLIRRAGSGYRLELVDGPPVNRHRPSVDVLFRSAAQSAGPRAAGVILTGMLDDGAAGLLEMFEAGSFTIAQDEATSVVFGMPREAIRRGAARRVLPLDRIAGAVKEWSNGARG